MALPVIHVRSTHGITCTTDVGDYELSAQSSWVDQSIYYWGLCNCLSTLYPTDNPGYRFVGWYTASSRPTSDIVDSTKSTWLAKSLGTGNISLSQLTKDVRGYPSVFAVYETASYSITVAPNGGTGGSANPSTYTMSSSSQTVTLTPPTAPTGKTFSSWSTTAGTVSGNTLTIPANTAGDITVTANWAFITYSVTVDPNGGSGGSASPSTYTKSSSSQNVTLTPPTAPTGKTFSSWSTTAGTVSGNTLTIPANTAGDITVTANWAFITYSVSFYNNGGSGTMSQQTGFVYGTAKQLSLNSFTKVGHTFDRWNTESGGTGTDYSDGAEMTTGTTVNNGVVKLYAQWSANEYDITLNQMGGTGGSESVVATYGIAMPIDGFVVPTKTGYTFAGYYDAETGGTQYYTATGSSARNWDKTSDTTLYARWTNKPYSVTREGVLGSVTSANTGYFGTPLAISWNSEGLDGYDYSLQHVKVYSGTDTSGVLLATYTTGTSANFTMSGTSYESIFIRAVYTKSGKQYSVTLDPTDGSGGATSVTATYGSAMPALSGSQLPTYQGHGFVGYYDAETGGTQYYTSTGSSARNWDKTTASTLYAHWEGIVSTITFDKRGGTGGSDSVLAAYGDPLSVIIVPTKTGQIFDGYYTDTTWATKIYDATGHGAIAAWDKTTDITVYAKWVSAGPYTVTFDANGGSTPSPATKQVTTGSPYGTLPTTSQTGKVFAGWFTSKTGGTEVTSTTVVSETQNHTLYAHWSDLTIRVDFDADGGTASLEYKTVTYGQKYGTLAAATKTDSTFLGWYTAKNGGTLVTEDSTVVNTEPHTLYAHWTGIESTVTFNSNGGSNPSFESKTVTSGQPYGTLPSVAFVGHVFDGWFTAASGGTKILETTVVSVSTDHTLYAHWSDEAPQVTFNATGGTVSPASKSLIYGEPYGVLPEPTRNGYSFEGWFTESYGGDEVTSSTVVSTSVAHTIYAHWTGNDVTITFDPNGGTTPSPASKTVTYGGIYGDLPASTQSDKTFIGWWTQRTGGSQILPGSTVSSYVSHSLYAHWTDHKAYSISDIDDLRGMIEIVPQPFATSPSSKTDFLDDKTEEFSASKSYKQGDVVWHDQRKYKAKNDVSAGPWTSTEWDEIAQDGITYQHGFSAEFSTPLPGGRVITRHMMNRLGNLGSQCQFFEQCGGFYTFDEDVSNAIGGYPNGAFLQFLDEDTNELRTVRSLADDNKNNFVANKAFIDGNASVGKWMYVDDNPQVGVEIDYSDYEDLSDTLFVETGIPDVYEVPYDSYLQMFAIGTIDCDSLRRDAAEDCQVYFEDEEGEKTYRSINGMFLTHGVGTSFLDVYSVESQTFGSVILGGWRPFEWIYWDANKEENFHIEKICPISPFTCGIMLSKGDKIRIRNSVKDTPLPVVDARSSTSSGWPKGVVHERVFTDSVLKRNYQVRFANLFKRGVRV